MSVKDDLISKRNELKAKQAELQEVWKAAGSEIDLSKVKKIGAEDASTWTSTRKTEEIRKRDEELNDLAKEVEGLAALVKAADRKHVPESKGVTQPDSQDPDGNKKSNLKTLGEMVRKDPQFKSWYESGQGGKKGALSMSFDVLPSQLFAADQLKGNSYLSKTLFETTAGWAPESTRIARLIDEPTRPIEVLDIIPMETTSQAAVVFMEETTRTHSAAETAEGAAYPESTFVLAEQSSTVRKIADSIPVTDEQLDDVPMVEGYLNRRLLFGVRQRLDTQIISGDGIAPNLTGIANATGLQTQALGGDPVPDAFYKAMDLIRVTGRANPTAIVMHANDWQAVRLLTTADGIYIWGSPSEAGPVRMWGLPVVLTTVSENTGFVGDFEMYCALFERRGVQVEVGFVGTQFTEGEKTMRAQMRAAFVIFRGAAFAEVTGI